MALVIFLLVCGSARAEIDWNDGQVKWHGYADGLEKMQAEGGVDF